MKDSWRLCQNLNIHKYSNLYKESNRTIYCLDKKGICNVDYNWWSNFSRDVLKFSFDDYCASSFNRLCRFPCR